MNRQLLSNIRLLAVLAVLAAAGAAPLGAQGLAQRIASAPDGRVQFTFASRDGSCGDGRTFMRVSTSTSSNEYYGTFVDGNGQQLCARGPVRVVLEQAAKTVVGVRVFVGPVAGSDGATDLGMVRAKDASDYLLGLAARAEGSVARDAIMPAMIADSVDNQAALLAIARDQTRSRETRRSAISWLGRGVVRGASVSQALLAIVNDENDNQSVRQQALRTLGHLEGGGGIPELIRLAGDREGGWVAREALSALAQSGDPRSRDYLRQVVRAAQLPDEALATAIRSLGQQYATATDIQLIRESFPKLSGQRSQDAALNAITSFGGGENARWLMSIARDPGQSQNIKSRALRSAVTAGVGVTELISLYNSTVDFQTKESIISALVQNGEREATDKLLAIAKDDESITARKRAIAGLAKSSDPRVRKELEALAEKR
jgi:HEAT repeat protein